MSSVQLLRYTRHWTALELMNAPVRVSRADEEAKGLADLQLQAARCGCELSGETVYSWRTGLTGETLEYHALATRVARG